MSSNTPTSSQSQMLNFLDIDLISPYLTTHTTSSSTTATSTTTTSNNINQTNLSNNTLFNSNPNLSFNDYSQAQNSLNEYSYSLDHLLTKDDLGLNGFILEQQHQPNHQQQHHHQDHILGHSQSLTQAQPNLRSRLSAPIKLSSSTSCSFLNDFYQQNQSQSPNNQSNIPSIMNTNNQSSVINQLKSHLTQTRSSMPNSINDNSLHHSIQNQPTEQQQLQQGFQIYNTTQTSNQADYSNQSEFQLDDFNLPTPTDSSVDDSLLLDQSQSQQQQQHQQQPQLETNQQSQLQQQTVNQTSQQQQLQQQDVNQISSQNISSNIFNLPNNSSNMSFIQSAQTQCPPGLISRSNSQPDLANTINLTYFNYYYNNPSSSSSSSINPVNYPNGYNHQSSMLLNNNKIRRYPSLTYKTSLSECGNDQDFINFNINDYINHNSSNQNSSLNSSNSNHYSNGFNNSFGINTSYSTTTSGVSSSSSLTTTSQDDGLFLGIEAITDFLNKNSGACSDLFDDIPDLEDLMSLVTFESSSTTSSSATAPSTSSGISVQSAPAVTTIFEEIKPQNQCNNLTINNILTTSPPDQTDQTNNLTTSNIANSFINCNPLSNFYDYTDMDSLIIDQNLAANLNINLNDNSMNSERTTRSAPPSPTPQRKKQRPTANLPWHKPWGKMDDDERSKTVECLTRIINDEMGLREQLEIIRILNPDTKLKPTDTQFVIDLKMIDDEKFKRIKDVIKTYGLSFNEKPLIDSTDCPLAKRELRIKRAQQRLKLKQKKEQRQMVKENKSGLFSKTEVVPLKRVLPEEDIDIDILS